MAESPFEPGRIVARLAAANLAVTPVEARALGDYLGLLVKWNRVYNLTGITDPAELIDRHLVESLALAPLLRGERVVDIGTGAGLPGIPLAIVSASRRFVLVDSRAKRTRFLLHVAGSIGLANVEVRQERAEHFRCDLPFDTLLARAVAPPAKLYAMTVHLTRPGSVYVLLTAERLEAEWKALATEHALKWIAPASPLPSQRGRIVVLERT